MNKLIVYLKPTCTTSRKVVKTLTANGWDLKGWTITKLHLQKHC